MCKYADNVFYGHGININKSEANKYYKISADKGNTNAINKLNLL